MVHRAEVLHHDWCQAIDLAIWKPSFGCQETAELGQSSLQHHSRRRLGSSLDAPAACQETKTDLKTCFSLLSSEPLFFLA